MIIQSYIQKYFSFLCIALSYMHTTMNKIQVDIQNNSQTLNSYFFSHLIFSTMSFYYQMLRLQAGNDFSLLLISLHLFSMPVSDWIRKLLIFIILPYFIFIPFILHISEDVAFLHLSNFSNLYLINSGFLFIFEFK